MNYSNQPRSVRVDIFKPSGKWYDTVALQWDRYFTTTGEDTELIHATFLRCMQEQFFNKWQGMTAVCLKPYHEHGCPLMITLPGTY